MFSKLQYMFSLIGMLFTAPFKFILFASSSTNISVFAVLERFSLKKTTYSINDCCLSASVHSLRFGPEKAFSISCIFHVSFKQPKCETSTNLTSLFYWVLGIFKSSLYIHSFWWKIICWKCCGEYLLPYHLENLFSFHHSKIKCWTSFPQIKYDAI